MWRIIEWLLDRLFTRYDITRPGVGVYLTRWDVFGNREGRGGKLYVHKFHRGDAEDYDHSHP